MNPRGEKTRSARLVERLASVRPLTWFLVHVGRHVDPVLMRLSNGRVNLTGMPAVVILHHTGAKTGVARQTPLGYFTDGPDVILVGSSGGAPHDPAWVHNVRANPDVELWVGERGGRYRAHVATPDERLRLWPMATEMYSGFDTYQARTGGREIPIVICSLR